MTDKAGFGRFMRIGGKHKNKRIVEVLFKQHYGELCNYAYAIVKDDSEAEDIVQQFFVDFIVYKRYKKVESSMEAYLFCSVKFAALKFLKQKIRKQHVLIDDYTNSLPADENKPGTINYKKALNQALNNLPPRCKEVFVMVHLQHLSYSEASDVLGVSINTVKTQLKRAISIIRGQVPYPFEPEFE